MSTNISNHKNGGENRTVFCVGLSALFFSIGFLAPVLGMVAIVLHSVIEGDVMFGRVGTALMVISIPTLLLASHCLDVTERRK